MADFMNEDETHFGSSKLDDLLKANEDLLPNEVKQALLIGHRVRFDIGAIIGPIVYEPIARDNVASV